MSFEAALAEMMDERFEYLKSDFADVVAEKVVKKIKAEDGLKSKEMPELMTRKEVMTFLRMGATKLADLTRYKILPPKKVGSKVLYNKQDVLNYLEA